MLALPVFCSGDGRDDRRFVQAEGVNAATIFFRVASAGGIADGRTQRCGIIAIQPAVALYAQKREGVSLRVCTVNVDFRSQEQDICRRNESARGVLYGLLPGVRCCWSTLLVHSLC